MSAPLDTDRHVRVLCSRGCPITVTQPPAEAEAAKQYHEARNRGHRVTFHPIPQRMDEDDVAAARWESNYWGKR